MAHKKAGGSTQLGRDSISKRLGIKRSDGQSVKPGMILVKQRGTKYRPGVNVLKGKDDSLFTTASGTVKITEKKVTLFNGKLAKRKTISVVKR